MARILVAYASTEGQTRKIAGFVGGVIADLGHQPEVVDCSDLPNDLDVGSADAHILAGSLHQGNHQPALVRYAQDHLAALTHAPTLFLSVSLTAVVHDEHHLAEAQKCIGRFVEQTGFLPTKSEPVAGALKYTEYDFLKRMLMQMISKSEGGGTDTARDYEYTDWNALRVTVEEFAKGVSSKG